VTNKHLNTIFLLGSLTVLALFLTTCTKEIKISDYSVIDIKEGIKLRKMALSADSAIFICGGNRESSGAIFRSVDKGQNFLKG